MTTYERHRLCRGHLGVDPLSTERANWELIAIDNIKTTLLNFVTRVYDSNNYINIKSNK